VLWTHQISTARGRRKLQLRVLSIQPEFPIILYPYQKMPKHHGWTTSVPTRFSSDSQCLVYIKCLMGWHKTLRSFSYLFYHINCNFCSLPNLWKLKIRLKVFQLHSLHFTVITHSNNLQRWPSSNLLLQRYHPTRSSRFAPIRYLAFQQLVYRTNPKIHHDFISIGQLDVIDYFTSRRALRLTD
jgi:hypothetical protein